jgi:hypothetical protein
MKAISGTFARHLIAELVAERYCTCLSTFSVGETFMKCQEHFIRIHFSCFSAVSKRNLFVSEIKFLAFFLMQKCRK